MDDLILEYFEILHLVPKKDLRYRPSWTLLLSRCDVPHQRKEQNELAGRLLLSFIGKGVPVKRKLPSSIPQQAHSRT